MEAVRHGILRAVSHSCVRITTSWLHVEADVKAEESREAGPSLLPNLISEESRPGSLRIFDVKDPQLRERSGTFQLFELPSQKQQLATPNHNTHTHTSTAGCVTTPRTPPGLHLGSTWAPPELHPDSTSESQFPRSHLDSIGDSSTPSRSQPRSQHRSQTRRHLPRGVIVSLEETQHINRDRTG